MTGVCWSYMQVVVNYASSSGAAEEVADQIKQSGGEAIVVQADLSKKEDIERWHSPRHVVSVVHASRPHDAPRAMFHTDVSEDPCSAEL